MPLKGYVRPRNPRRVLNSGGYYPACFNSAREYSEWRLLLRQSRESMRVGYCYDCTPDYKMEMMCEGRCEHPETQFVVLRDSGNGDEIQMIGVSDQSIYWARVEQGAAVIDGAEDGEDQQQGEGQVCRKGTDW
jgi:hypothetical protein